MITCQDSLSYLKELSDFDIDMIYADPPYALGSEVIIRKDGKVDYAKANDFMNKWTMPTGSYWEAWFIEAYRTLKHGGYLIMFGMDRQLLLFKYYACLAGFVEQQSLYWYFISNFPKATDLSKMIEKNAGIEPIGSKPPSFGLANKEKGWNTVNQQLIMPELQTDLAKKYEGYKYSISPLKQTNETIMVFQKPCLTGSPLHDTLAYENGDKTITVSALNIDGNRVGVSGGITHCDNRDENGKCLGHNNAGKTTSGETVHADESDGGRYPAQTFIDSKVAEILDRQSGVSKSQMTEISNVVSIVGNGIYGGSENSDTRLGGYDDIGGCSKILHKCDYTDEDYDLYNYEPKVSASERSAGCDDREAINVNDGRNTPIDNPYQRGETLRVNTHPTLKPIALNEKILKLFKTPNDQKICYPFAGAGSEIIGGIKAGFDNWCGCEISQEYVDIANARIKYWKEEMTTQTSIFDFIGKD